MAFKTFITYLSKQTLEAIKRQLRMRRLRKDKKIPEGLSSFCENREYMFLDDRESVTSRASVKM